ncbi:phytoene/squalene synthase family protein [Hansschlegelia zhihuaiae]|uniref:Phytoene/squalene synthase family protein n=1 Tax=Hansschlegelia zhihuaiae TaxID=405005 RepID=A0A4Q0MLH0_9HYPH|nr:squalene/phytoene synthase family protein [Hansschlegelia zhihuaiae]RXF74550.1 hypothetical protein EK403_03875 [Hansschlegelia zhihuaiae]
MSPVPDDTVASLVRDADFGRYAATLFAPAPARPHLLALYAFEIELARVRDIVSDPMVGEIRLQWWRDALADPERADAVAHPVAKALEGAIAYGRLPREALLALTDAWIDDLYDDPIASLEDLEARLGATSAATLRLATLVAARGEDPGGSDVAGLAGVADGLARLLRLLPKHVARGQILLPVDLMAKHDVSRDEVVSGPGGPALARLVVALAGHGRKRLAEARTAYTALAPSGRAATLPLCFVDRDLDRIARKAAPFAPPPEEPRWRMLLRLWNASRREPPF